MNCKITNINGMTQNDTQWGENARHEATGKGKTLCSDGFIHFYEDELLAVFMNPAHGNFKPMRLWQFEPEGEIITDGSKSGCKAGRTIKEIPIPEITTEQRVEIAIRCALPICKNTKWLEWANKWLSGEDRTTESAYAASAAAYAASAADAAYASYAAYAASAAEKGINILSIIKEVIHA
jgi:hypothetical protein